MQLTTFICNDKTLSQMDFNTVYQTITALITKGIVSADAFARPSASDFETYIEDGAFLQIQR